MVNRGLAASVSPSKMIGVVKTNVLKILDYYERNNLDMDVAKEEIDDYISWISNLKVGPKTILKNGDVVQQPLGAFYIQDGEDKIETLLSEVNKKKAEVIKNQNAFDKQQEEETISNTLNNLDFSRTQFKDGKEALSYFKNIGNTLDALAEKYPERIEFLYKQYDLRNFSVDDFFFELETAYDDGIVTQSQALIQVTDVMQALGPNASKADRDKYTKLKKYLGETDGKSIEQRFPEMKGLMKYGQKTVGKVKDGLRVIESADDVDRMEDLNIKLKSLVKENGGIDAQIDIRGQRTTVRNWYLGELRKIKDSRKFGKYEFFDDALDLSQPIESEEIPDDDEDNQDDDNTVNIQEQKVLTYDTNTKLFSEANTNELQVGPNTTVVSINGSVTPAGESLRQNLNIKSFENFNIDFYNATFEDNQTETTNEKLLSDDLEPSAFSDVSEKESPTTVEVEQGDTLSELADQFSTTVEAIMKANNLTNADMINIGQELIMPIVTLPNSPLVKRDQMKALDVILKDTDKTKTIPQPKIREMLLAVGFKPEIARIMSAVFMAESAGNPLIDTVKSGLDPQKENEFSIGIGQINMKDDKDRLLKLFDIQSIEELYDPIINVISAKRLYDEQGLGAWGAYTDNSYKDFLTD
jgi:LysM repeat protein